LDNITLPPTRKNAQPETGQVIVPHEVLGWPDLGGLDNALGQLGHGAVPVQVLSASWLSPPPALEALWKQEGENRGASLRKTEWELDGSKSTKYLKTRNKRKLCAFLRRPSEHTHNLKVIVLSPHHPDHLTQCLKQLTQQPTPASS
jgi:hypothetical protein